ncbi:MAG: hypothetical protein ACFB0B_11280 [Thermonemataceae bacterium]
MKTINLLYLLAFLLLINSCDDKKNSKDNQKDTTAEVDSLSKTEDDQVSTNTLLPPEVDSYHNQLANFVAGIPVDSTSELFLHTQNAGWKNYQQYADQTWTKINNNKLPLIAQWRDEALAEANTAGGLVFYPFSGADFLHAQVFFPKAEEYVLIGLEPIGSIPDIPSIPAERIGSYFQGIRHTLYAIMELSFFRTIAMAQDFTGKVVQQIDGTLPVLLLFIARTDHEVLFIEQVAINPDGELVAAEEVEEESTIYGNKIYFKEKGENGKNKVLYYFQANIDNKPYTSRSGYASQGLDKRSDLYNYLKKLNITTTYVKSASYLMHRENFSKIRDVILEQSTYYLQDDSGIPVRFFDEDQWALTFYGNYYAPIQLFSIRVQKDLRAIYQKKDERVRPLPFGIGYQYQKGTSNLMFAKKKTVSP